jgi:hypothetical protein
MQEGWSRMMIETQAERHRSSPNRPPSWDRSATRRVRAFGHVLDPLHDQAGSDGRLLAPRGRCTPRPRPARAVARLSASAAGPGWGCNRTAATQFCRPPVTARGPSRIATAAFLWMAAPRVMAVLFGTSFGPLPLCDRPETGRERERRSGMSTLVADKVVERTRSVS